jgi:hypothetical protein
LRECGCHRAPDWAHTSEIAYNGCEDASYYRELTVCGRAGAGAAVIGKTALPNAPFEGISFSLNGSSLVV